VSGRAISAVLTILSYGAILTELNQGELGGRTMRGLGVHWMDILYFMVVSGSIIAGGYFALHILRRR